METWNGVKTFYAKDIKTWRSWLQKNGAKEKSIWLILYKKISAKKSVTYPEAVEEALCFGWIDSKPNKRDEESYFQFFARRNPKSSWSKINKDRVEKLIREKRMTASGLALIEQAKINGAWTALEKIDNLELPDDLQKLLSKNKRAATYFEAFPPSIKKGILEWIQNARTKETKQKRIDETVRLATENIRANQYVPKQ